MNLTTPRAVVMVRPHAFSPNPETAWDNHFQANEVAVTADLALSAYQEVTEAVRLLAAEGVDVHLFEDRSTKRPDAVFPNNWFSTHPDGRIAVYPMAVPNRRAERREDVLALLKQRYRVTEVIDYSAWEFEACYLEGTGAMVLDHENRVAFAARSHRLDPRLFSRFCEAFDYQPCLFRSEDDHGFAVYHTNVMLCVAQHFALVGLDWVTAGDREHLLRRLRLGGRVVIALSPAQIGAFAGNALELSVGTESLLALSTTAYAALTVDQKEQIEQTTRLVPLNVPTIEMAGGSVRCMLAGIHLPSR